MPHETAFVLDRCWTFGTDLTAAGPRPALPDACSRRSSDRWWRPFSGRGTWAEQGRGLPDASQGGISSGAHQGPAVGTAIATWADPKRKLRLVSWVGSPIGGRKGKDFDSAQTARDATLGRAACLAESRPGPIRCLDTFLNRDARRLRPPLPNQPMLLLQGGPPRSPRGVGKLEPVSGGPFQGDHGCPGSTKGRPMFFRAA